MRRLSEKDATHQFDELLDIVQREPAAICREGEEFAIVVSAAEYDRLRGLTQAKRNRQVKGR